MKEEETKVNGILHRNADAGLGFTTAVKKNNYTLFSAERVEVPKETEKKPIKHTIGADAGL